MTGRGKVWLASAILSLGIWAVFIHVETAALRPSTDGGNQLYGQHSLTDGTQRTHHG
ncbi:hypothetical protein [Rhizobium sp. FY34]|uniref:hypothetical protein n=1 Tax=Rhizobium sp. FY34 TaxID=2562309 RepID=UPI001485655E|nr:hypothetical protein [Rhizobium sp. FY34]